MNLKVHIIAREGSKRVTRKNLRLLNKKPMVSYSIEAALGSQLIKKENIFLNTECPEIAEIGRNLGVSIYDRDPRLAQDEIVLDELTYDFIKHEKCDVVGMINPVCPLTTGSDIDRGLIQFTENNYDSLITVREEQLQSFCRDKPINFSLKQKINRTQDLDPTQIVTWNFCFWRAEKFKKNMNDKGFGVFGGKLGLFPIDKTRAIKVSLDSDFQIAEAMLRAREVCNTKVVF